MIGLPFGLAQFTGIVSMPPSIAPTFLQLDFSRICELTFLIVVFSILFVDVFDNAGTLIGVTHRTGLMKNGKLARMKEALISDSFAAMFGALIGTSTTTSYIESAAGVSAGGRTGLTAAFVGVFFLLALFFAPLAGMVPAYASAAALLYVACVMARGLGRDRLGGHHRICAGGGDRNHHAADLFDRDRHRPWLHHLCARQDHLPASRRGRRPRSGAGGAVRDQVRGDRLAVSAFLIARKSRQAKRFCSGLRSRKAG